MPPPKKTRQPAKQLPPDSLTAGSSNPLDWLINRPLDELKEWLTQAIRHRNLLPVVVPVYSVPESYLLELLIQASRKSAETQTHLRQIITEWLAQWRAYEDQVWLDNLLTLCGNLGCSEAEPIIARIMVDKLSASPDDTYLRQHCLSVLQSIGTDRTRHLYKRYIDQIEYAPLCYRGLYRLNLTYAATELPSLVQLHQHHRAMEQLQDVLDLLFNDTLTPPEYIFVLQPFADQAASTSFVAVLSQIIAVTPSLLHDLSPVDRSAFLHSLIKRARPEDLAEIRELMHQVGVELNPPPYQPPTPEERLGRTPTPPTPVLARLHNKGYFTTRLLNPSSGLSEEEDLIHIEDLDQKQVLGLIRGYPVGELDTLFGE